MHRTPPRRQPRIAALVPSRGAYVLVVLDAWEVRAVAIARCATAIRRLLAQERPAVVLATRTPSWLRRSGMPVQHAAPSATRPNIAAFPELRRFVGTVHERAIRAAVAVANEALTQRP